MGAGIGIGRGTGMGRPCCGCGIGAGMGTGIGRGPGCEQGLEQADAQAPPQGLGQRPVPHGDGRAPPLQGAAGCGNPGNEGSGS